MSKAVIVWDRSDPLAQADGESNRANQALRNYVHMGTGRSLRRLVELYRKRCANHPQPDSLPSTTSLATLNSWSLKYDWTARADRFDALAALDAEAWWRERREGEREEEWQMARTLFERGREIMAYPLFVEVEDEDGQTVRRPTNWRMADAAKFIELGVKLARQAARMRDDDPAESALPEVVFYIPENGRPIRQPDDDEGDDPD